MVYRSLMLFFKLRHRCKCGWFPLFILDNDDGEEEVKKKRPDNLFDEERESDSSGKCNILVSFVVTMVTYLC